MGIIFPQSFLFLLLRNRKSSFLSFLFGGGSARFVAYPLNIHLFPTFFSRSYHLTQFPPHYTQGWYIPPASNLRETRTNPIFRGLRIRALHCIPTQASSYAEVHTAYLPLFRDKEFVFQVFEQSAKFQYRTQYSIHPTSSTKNQEPPVFLFFPHAEATREKYSFNLILPSPRRLRPPPDPLQPPQEVAQPPSSSSDQVVARTKGLQHVLVRRETVRGPVQVKRGNRGEDAQVGLLN